MFGLIVVVCCGMQAQQSSAPVIRVDTRLVNVVVNATEPNGAPVSDLEQSNFRVLEDGKEQKLAIFEKQTTTPLSMVMAVDTSESVLSQFQTERSAAKKFIEQMLRSQDEMDLFAFSDNVDELVPFTNNAPQVQRGLGRLQRGDATSLYNAVYLASQRLMDTRKDATRRRALILITDGGDTVKGGLHYPQAVEEAQRAGVAIYPIIIMPILSDAGRNVAGEHALIQMAEDTGGKYFYVTAKKDLADAFAHLSEDLRTQYLLAYYAPLHEREEDAHSIQVQLTNPALQERLHLRYRTSYYATAR